MCVAKSIFVGVVLLACIFGCGEEPPLEVVNETSGREGMVFIPAGEFQMGDAFDEGWDEELPVHTVYLDAFYIDKYEVTNIQFKKFIEANPRWQKDKIDPKYYDYDYLEDWNGNNYPEGKGNHPVICVSWYAAAAYAQWAGKRLPTEAEWEKAARGGLPGKRFVWGDAWPPPKGAGNFPDETAKKKIPDLTIIAGYDDGYAETAPVGSFNPNDYGVYDMAGNVWEWCVDEYDGDYYSVSPKNNPKGPGATITFTKNDFTNVVPNYARVLRSSGWGRDADDLRVACRGICLDPTFMDKDIGFRCVTK